MVFLVCFDHLFGMAFTLYGLMVSLWCLVGFVVVRTNVWLVIGGYWLCMQTNVDSVISIGL